MTRYLVGNVSEFEDGQKKIIAVGGKSVGIYEIGGQLHAIRNLCPHQGAELCRGVTAAWVDSSGPGDFRFEREGEIVRCPWHQWEFDIRTGCMVVDPATRTMTYGVTVERYDVTVEEEQVFVHM
ncbi:Rieske (2Fe-2S) protein [Paenibacillus sp. HB172176]|uniref:Rieske (2Fe-2S) protein n=1 Tax=Paenibacillus sp. HB172176 TaxID=2493690 RepID=UPI00143B98D6|nr:Rieske (2Fe-2S) protein [Paenibacillus sp. HB172176]